MADQEGEDPLPKGWEKRTSRSTGQSYYLNVFTKESQWEVPTEEASSKDNEKIRCSHLLVKHSGSRYSSILPLLLPDALAFRAQATVFVA